MAISVSNSGCGSDITDKTSPIGSGRKAEGGGIEI